MKNKVNRTFLFLLLGIALFIILGYFFSNIYSYVGISLVLSAILRPLVNYVNSATLFGLRFPRVLAVLISFSLLVGLLVALVVLFIPLVNEQFQVISNLDPQELSGSVQEPLNQLERFLKENNLIRKTSEEGYLFDTLTESFSLQDFFQRIDFTLILNSLVSLTGSVFIGVLAVSFITFFFLYEKGMVRRRLISLIPNRYFEVSIAALYKIERLLSNYLIGLLGQMTAIFTIASVGLSIFGIRYALTIALFAAVANLIPYAGPILGSAFGILVGISTSTDLVTSNDYILLIVKIVAVFSTVQLTDNLVLQPLIFSKSVKAHPLEIFIIIFAGASLAGIMGMIIAIPVYTVLRVSIMELYKGYRSYHIFKSN